MNNMSVLSKRTSQSQLHSPKNRPSGQQDEKKFRLSKANVRNLFGTPAEPSISDLYDAKQRLHARLDRIKKGISV